MTYDFRRTTEPTPGLRLLPWTSPEGLPCYVKAGSPPGVVSRLADEIEEAQLDNGVEVLTGARAVLDDARAGEPAVRFALRRSVESLDEVIRVADCRGARLLGVLEDGEAKAADGAPAEYGCAPQDSGMHGTNPYAGKVPESPHSGLGERYRR